MNKIIVLLGVVLFIAGIIYFSANELPQNTVALGVIAGTTGEYAAAGEGYVKGFELARNYWNATHALQFEASFEDDSFNAQKGISAYKKLKSTANPQAYAVLSTFTIDAIAQDLLTEGKPVALGFEQSTPAQDDVIFQVLPAARPVQKGLGEYLKTHEFKKPFLMVSNNTPVYQNFAEGFKEGYGEGAAEELLSSDATSLRAAAGKTLSQHADVVVLFMVPKDGAVLAREILRQSGGPHPQLVFDQSIQSGIADYKTVFGADMEELNGALVALSRNDLTEGFRTLYENKYGEDAPFGADMGYNSFMLLALTYDKDPEKWKENMNSVSFTGADGEVRFDSVGRRVPNTAFATLQNGSLVF